LQWGEEEKKKMEKRKKGKVRENGKLAKYCSRQVRRKPPV
jgi:hypothetical protein